METKGGGSLISAHWLPFVLTVVFSGDDKDKESYFRFQESDVVPRGSRRG